MAITNNISQQYRLSEFSLWQEANLFEDPTAFRLSYTYREEPLLGSVNLGLFYNNPEIVTDSEKIGFWDKLKLGQMMQLGKVLVIQIGNPVKVNSVSTAIIRLNYL